MHSAAIFTPILPLLPLCTAAGAATLGRQNPGRNSTAFASWSSKSNKPQAQSNLTGSAVLHALQQAVSEKERKIMKKRKQQQQQQQLNQRMERGNEREEEEELFDYGNVRDIEIRSDWEARIEQLEKRVQELQSQYHHHY